MGGGRAALMAGLLFLAGALMPLASSHTQQTLTVIMVDDGVVSGNITDPAFVQGNALWFRMEDSTENTSMVIRVDVNQDGVFNASDDFESTTLVNECELNETGALVDENCAVSTTYAFGMNATVGTYAFWVHRTSNETETVWNHTVAVHKDVHEEEGPTPGDCFGAGCPVDESDVTAETSTIANIEDSLLTVLMGVSLVGIALVIAMPKKEEE